jgi:WD40 repeat protein
MSSLHIFPAILLVGGLLNSLTLAQAEVLRCNKAQRSLSIGDTSTGHVRQNTPQSTFISEMSFRLDGKYILVKPQLEPTILVANNGDGNIPSLKPMTPFKFKQSPISLGRRVPLPPDQSNANALPYLLRLDGNKVMIVSESNQFRVESEIFSQGRISILSYRGQSFDSSLGVQARLINASSDGTNIATLHADGVVRLFSDPSFSQQKLKFDWRLDPHIFGQGYTSDIALGNSILFVATSQQNGRSVNIEAIDPVKALGSKFKLELNAGETFKQIVIEDGVLVLVVENTSTQSPKYYALLRVDRLKVVPNGNPAKNFPSLLYGGVTQSHYDYITDLATSSHGDFYVTASRDRTVKITDGDGLVTHSFHQNEFVLSTSFSRDGQDLMTTSIDGVVKVIGVASGEVIWSFRNESPIVSQSFSSDGNLALVVTESGIARMFNRYNGEVLFELSGEFLDAKFTDDNLNLFHKNGKGTTLKLPEMKILSSWSWVHKGSPTIGISNNGRFLVTSSPSGESMIRDQLTQKIVGKFGYNRKLLRAFFSPNDRVLINENQDWRDNLQVVSLTEDGVPTIEYTLNLNATAKNVVISQDSRYAIIVLDNGQARLLDVNTGEMASIGLSEVTDAAFRKDSRSVVLAYRNGQTQVVYLK